MTKLYDIQGTPIKVGNLVAFKVLGDEALHKDRVRSMNSIGQVLLRDGSVRWDRGLVVLEEPVWPNS